MIATNPKPFPHAVSLDGLRALLAKLSGCKVEQQTHRLAEHRFWHEEPRRHIPTRVVTIDVEDVLAFHGQVIEFEADGAAFVAKPISAVRVNGRAVFEFEVEGAP